MSLFISRDLLEATRMTEAEVKTELAVVLFQREKLTLAQAARLSGLGLITFQQLLGSRDIPLHYDVAEFEEDLATLAELGVR